MATRTHWLYTDPQPTRAAAAIQLEAQIQSAQWSEEELHQLAGVEVITEDIDGTTHYRYTGFALFRTP
ncbi:hypothetical protein [Curtobacterium sp. MCBD17_026]|uniref:hypothetical protein n=1 Tax=Curtobacterium sp. MCBD17_026 TaxID=2175621 RepID=UPI000DAA1075|nr:hypothetical protein [Curtobacterium sp. MCBD17_026]WIB72580.1 hypothetical protein DEI85_17470 [Curtobacterium sp. MCBD17_026]